MNIEDLKDVKRYLTAELHSEMVVYILESLIDRNCDGILMKQEDNGVFTYCTISSKDSSGNTIRSKDFNLLPIEFLDSDLVREFISMFLNRISDYIEIFSSSLNGCRLLERSGGDIFDKFYKQGVINDQGNFINGVSKLDMKIIDPKTLSSEELEELKRLKNDENSQIFGPDLDEDEDEDDSSFGGLDDLIDNY